MKNMIGVERAKKELANIGEFEYCFIIVDNEEFQAMFSVFISETTNILAPVVNVRYSDKTQEYFTADEFLQTDYAQKAPVSVLDVLSKIAVFIPAEDYETAIKRFFKGAEHHIGEVIKKVNLVMVPGTDRLTVHSEDGISEKYTSLLITKNGDIIFGEHDGSVDGLVITNDGFAYELIHDDNCFKNHFSKQNKVK